MYKEVDKGKFVYRGNNGSGTGLVSIILVFGFFIIVLYLVEGSYIGAVITLLLVGLICFLTLRTSYEAILYEKIIYFYYPYFKRRNVSILIDDIYKFELLDARHIRGNPAFAKVFARTKEKKVIVKKIPFAIDFDHVDKVKVIGFFRSRKVKVVLPTMQYDGSLRKELKERRDEKVE